MIEPVAAKCRARSLAAHFHDTYGQALANIMAVLERGIDGVRHAPSRVSAAAPTPRARRAMSATEDVIYLLNGLGVETGVELGAVVEAGTWISGVLGRRNEVRSDECQWLERARIAAIMDSKIATLVALALRSLDAECEAEASHAISVRDCTTSQSSLPAKGRRRQRDSVHILSLSHLTCLTCNRQRTSMQSTRGAL